MTTVLVLILATWILVLLGCVWAELCNIRTCQQRKRLIVRIPRQVANWRSYAREWDAVSYEQHLWCLIRLGDPRKLYGPLTQEIW